MDERRRSLQSYQYPCRPNARRCDLMHLHENPKGSGVKTSTAGQPCRFGEDNRCNLQVAVVARMERRQFRRMGGAQRYPSTLAPALMCIAAETTISRHPRRRGIHYSLIRGCHAPLPEHDPPATGFADAPAALWLVAAACRHIVRETRRGWPVQRTAETCRCHDSTPH